MNITITETGSLALLADLTRAAYTAPIKARAAVQITAAKIKRDAAAGASGLAHAPYYPSSITYDTRMTATGAEAIIGPDKNRKQGALGNILEFGTAKNAPHPHLGPALDRNTPDFLRGMEIAAYQSLR